VNDLTTSQPVDLKRALESAKIELQDLRHSPFSDEGFEQLTKQIDAYIVELTTESVRVARRYKSDTVSPAYVDEASHHLVTGKTARWHKLVGSAGGVMFGMGLTSVVRMIVETQYSGRGLALSMAAIILGLFGLTYHVLKD
jgi:histone H3/H4